MENVFITVDCSEWLRELPNAQEISHSAAVAALSSTKSWGKSDLEISITLSDDKTLQELNNRYRNKNETTNVLAFQLEQDSAIPGQPILLGDVIIALGIARREAEEQGKKLTNHLKHLVIHGVLHLLGLDHQNKRDAVTMESIEIGVLRSLGTNDPYVEK